MKSRTVIVMAKSAKKAALKEMVSPWNKGTQELITKTITHIASSNKTDVYSAIQHEAEGKFPASVISAYVQMYDVDLDLYQVSVQDA